MLSDPVSLVRSHIIHRVLRGLWRMAATERRGVSEHRCLGLRLELSWCGISIFGQLITERSDGD